MMNSLKRKIPVQKCPNCGKIMGAIVGSRDAICKNCGYKEPCCD